MRTYDTIVIGGGPAGMMAAGRAAECGARVLLIEKNDSLGRKLLISGGGRSNITNTGTEGRPFLEKFGDASKFLHSPFSRFGVRETLDFFASRGLPTKTEGSGRVFPKSDDAHSVRDVLGRYMADFGVTVMSDRRVTGFVTEDDAIVGVALDRGGTVRARSYVLATGGKSHPETGSTGDGFVWLKAIGHTVVESRPSLVPLRIREPWVRELSGTAFPEAGLAIFQDGKKKDVGTGTLLFTHFGLSGPLALNMSRRVDSLLRGGPVTLVVDLFPHADTNDLDARLRERFDSRKNRRLKNALEGFLPPLCVPVIIGLSGMDPEKPVHDLRREERLALTRTLKGLTMTVEGLLGADRSIVTSGGLDPKEVDFRHMRSRIHPNLYPVGDILDIDRPSGGYSLQLCWTTGYVAGTCAAEL